MPPPRKSRDDAARLLNVSPRSVENAARVLRAAMQAQNAAERVVMLAEQRIGAELKAAQERGEVATQAEHGRGIQSSVHAADTRATLPDLGIPRKRAAEAKALAELGLRLAADPRCYRGFAAPEGPPAAFLAGRRLRRRPSATRAT